jgi:carbamoyl-phosphate synthase large subunit
MPRRKDIKSILIIGAGPIIIGQACEFDYSGAQACKALKEEGFRVILVNSNPATIMTDPLMADATYIEPIHWESVEKIIEKEKPDAILPTMGGQTALNTALSLDKHGVLKKHGVILIGANREAIDKAEDRQLFDETMQAIGIETPSSGIAHSMEDAIEVQKRIGFPCIIRPSFTMGGTGGGIAYNIDEFEAICKKGLELSPTNELLIDESLIGWKEFEMEVVRDCKDNCIIVCSIENLDPMGVHTGDSITIAPAQTLTDKEYQIMRNASFKILREIGVDTGGSNVQFAINPDNGKMVVIEMNPRVSRSSALASKATGFPIAKVAALLSVGYTLDELKNDITGGLTPASFEPSIDYIVTKIPKFAFEKFPQAEPKLTTQMKSVGEVMAIGSNFQESLQKALASMEEDLNGLNSIVEKSYEECKEEILYQLTFPGPKRLFYVCDAIRAGWGLEKIYELTKIDYWFLDQLEEILNIEKSLQTKKLSDLDHEAIYLLKKKGFTDSRIAELINFKESDFRDLRKELGILPVYRRVDTCAAEFATSTCYMYSTYADQCESNPTNNKKILVLGSGPNRIGQGIEFDYCCVHASLAMQEEGYESIMVNCNPETVSTDYDVSNRLYFEPITAEKILDIIDNEKPEGVIIQFGGQTPLKLADVLSERGVKILGTDVDAIDRSEDRERFQELIQKLDLKQPANATVKNISEAMIEAEKIGFPIVVRPSYVLGGRAMQLVHNLNELELYLNEAVEVSNSKPILLDSYLTDAVEVDVDVVSDGKEIQVGGILQHIEQAGIHSGDSACSLPPYSLSEEIQKEISDQSIKIGKELDILGLMNIQFAVKDDLVYIIEVNPRASRTVPFISKAIGSSLVKVASKAMIGNSLANQKFSRALPNDLYFVKEAVLPFDKFPLVDPILGPEMKSTGEVMGIGIDFGEAYAKAQKGANKILPRSGTVFISVKDSDKKYLDELLPLIEKNGFEMVATGGTAAYIKGLNYNVKKINKVLEGRPHTVDSLLNKEIDLVINTTEGTQSIKDSAAIRRTALQNKIFCTTTMFGAFAIMQALNGREADWSYKTLQEIHNS